MANEHVRLIRKLYSRPNLPVEVQKVRAQAFSAMHFAAAAVSASDRLQAAKHLMASFRYNPLSFLLSFQKLTFVLLAILPGPAGRLLIRTWRAGRRIRQRAARSLQADPRERWGGGAG